MSIDGDERIVDARRVTSTGWSLLPEGGGRARLVELAEAGETVTATVEGATFAMTIADARKAAAARADRPRATTGPFAIRAPMPGKVIKVLVKPGDAIKSGQGLLVVEAMKMENELRAPRDGVIGEVKVAEGQPVEANQTLATLV